MADCFMPKSKGNNLSVSVLAINQNTNNHILEDKLNIHYRENLKTHVICYTHVEGNSISLPVDCIRNHSVLTSTVLCAGHTCRHLHKLWLIFLEIT